MQNKKIQGVLVLTLVAFICSALIYIVYTWTGGIK